MLTLTRESDLCLCLCVECFRAGVHSRTQDLRQEVDQVWLRWQSRRSYQDSENTADWGNCLACTDVPRGKLPPSVSCRKNCCPPTKTNCAMHQLFREREHLCDWNLESIEGRHEETYCLSVATSSSHIAHEPHPLTCCDGGREPSGFFSPSCNMLNIRGVLDSSQSSKVSCTHK